MSLHHFFLEDQVLADEGDAVFPLRLAADDLKHAHVLRLQPGEHVAVVDAASDYFECEVVSFDADGMTVRIASKLDAPARPHVVLLQGIAKGEKMDQVVRHATELGVSGIVPLACERSIVKLDAKKAASRTQRWRAIAKSAAMQAGLAAMPEVSEPLTVREASHALAGATAVLVFWEEAPLDAKIALALADALGACGCADAADARVAVVVGPEGGLPSREVALFHEAGPRTHVVTLGPSILRTETAGVVAPALVLYELEGR